MDPKTTNQQQRPHHVLLMVMNRIFQWRDNPDRAALAVRGGFQIVIVTVALTILLEIMSLDTVRAHLMLPLPSSSSSSSSSKLSTEQQLQTSNRAKTQQQQQQRKLYIQGWIMNLVNHVCLGIPLYVIPVVHFCRQTPQNTATDLFQKGHASSPVGWWWLVSCWIPSIFRVAATSWIHAVCYYTLHQWAHINPTIYQFHKFHHLFHTHVPPSSANAVSVPEYFAAYLMPFLWASFLIQPTETELRYAVLLLSVTNLVVHTPRLEIWSQQWIPVWWVSTNNHLDHHRHLLVHYASPTFNIDWMIRSIKTTTIKK